MTDTIENIRWVPSTKQRAAMRLASHAAALGGDFWVSLTETAEFAICRDGTSLRFKTEAACRRALNELAA